MSRTTAQNAQWRPARIAAGHDFLALLAQPIGQQANLRRFADAIDAVEREKHGARSRESLAGEERPLRIDSSGKESRRRHGRMP